MRLKGRTRRHKAVLTLRRPRIGRLEERGQPRRDATPSSFETRLLGAPQDEGAFTGPVR
jgi:hypothetical protein